MPIVNCITDYNGRFTTFMKLTVIVNSMYMYLFYVSFASLGLVLEGAGLGLGLGLCTAGLDYKTDINVNHTDRLSTILWWRLLLFCYNHACYTGWAEK